jgi:hypothetical protein
MSKRITNRVAEHDIRHYLTAQGYGGRGARFHALDLFAIERPGWVQVFTFSVRAVDHDGRACELWGVLRDDERRGLKIELADTDEERDRIANDWSRGLITARRGARGPLQTVLVAACGLVLAVALLGALLSAARRTPGIDLPPGAALQGAVPSTNS